MTDSTTHLRPAAPRDTALPGGYPRAEAVAAIAPTVGHLQLRLGGPGAGKTADAAVLVPALARTGVTLYASGHHDRVGTIVRTFGLTGENTDVSGNVRIIGPTEEAPDPVDLRAIVVLLYKEILRAVRKDAPLPAALVVDDVAYVGLKLATRPTSPTVAQRMIADLLVAIAWCDLARIGELVGLTYEQWSGEPAPDLTDCGITVVGYCTIRPSLAGHQPAQLPVGPLSLSASSIVELQRADGHRRFGGLMPPSDVGQFVVRKSRTGNEGRTVPMRFDADAGYRGRWTDEV